MITVQLNPSVYKHDGDLLELLLLKKKALTLRKANSSLYSHLCSHLKGSKSGIDTAGGPNTVLFSRLLHCSEEEVTESLSLKDRAKRVKDVARQLYDGGFILEAGALLISAQPAFHPELATLNDSLAYATKMLSK